MQQTIDTVTNWSGTIAALTTKRQTALARLSELQAEKKQLALEAALGGADAKKRLERVNTEISRLALDLDTCELALSAARGAEQKAKANAVADAEQERHRQRVALATEAILHAREFTKAMQQAVEAGYQLRVAVRSLCQLLPPDDQKGPANLLRANPFMRAAEKTGLRAFIEFPRYSGSQAHIVPLEEESLIYLSRWLELSDPPVGSGN